MEEKTKYYLKPLILVALSPFATVMPAFFYSMILSLLKKEYKDLLFDPVLFIFFSLFLLITIFYVFIPLLYIFNYFQIKLFSGYLKIKLKWTIMTLLSGIFYFLMLIIYLIIFEPKFPF